MSSKQNTAAVEALIGERIRSRRIQANVSQDTLGRALGRRPAGPVQCRRRPPMDRGSRKFSVRLLEIRTALF